MKQHELKRQHWFIITDIIFANNCFYSTAQSSFAEPFKNHRLVWERSNKYGVRRTNGELMAPSNGHLGLLCLLLSIPVYWMRMHEERTSPRVYLSSLMETHRGDSCPQANFDRFREDRRLFVFTLPAADMRSEMRSSWPGAPKMMMMMTTTAMMVRWRWAVLIGRFECQALTTEAGGLCGESVYRAGGVLWSRLRTWIK